MGSNGLPPKREQAMGASIPKLAKSQVVATSPPPPTKGQVPSNGSKTKEADSDSYSPLLSIAMLDISLDAAAIDAGFGSGE